MRKLKCKLLVIGAGPGGYVCAIKAGKLGVDTIIVEATKAGGTCLNVGCIPSKALIHAAEAFHQTKTHAQPNQLGISCSAPTIDFSQTIDWKNSVVQKLTSGVEGLLKKSKVHQITGYATFVDGKTVHVSTEDGMIEIGSGNVVIATGSELIELPTLPFGEDVLSSTDILNLRNLPKSLAVIGGGYIGLELGTAMAKIGVKVDVIEADANILSQYDAMLTKPVRMRLKQLGVDLHLNTKAMRFDADKKLLTLEHNGDQLDLSADKVLVTVGRRPNLRGFGIERLGLTMSGAFLKIDNSCRTSMRGTYAIGDITGEPMLAHRAMAQGEMVAEIIAGENKEWDKRAIPAVCFTDPEIVSAGPSLSELEASGHKVITGAFPFKANGRALSTQRDDGVIQVIARQDTHEILAIHAVGEGISELASAFSLAVEMAGRLEDLSQTIQAHPTRGEALQEAALSALGMPLHM